jgi:hypothetical protein
MNRDTDNEPTTQIKKTEHEQMGEDKLQNHCPAVHGGRGGGRKFRGIFFFKKISRNFL